MWWLTNGKQGLIGNHFQDLVMCGATACKLGHIKKEQKR